MKYENAHLLSVKVKLKAHLEKKMTPNRVTKTSKLNIIKCWKKFEVEFLFNW
jgi:hypothetical protein